MRSYISPVFGEVLADMLYDRQVYPANAGWNLTFFERPVGVNGKTFADTNMLLHSALPVGNRFLACVVEIIFLPAAHLDKAQRLADVNAVARSGVVEFKIQNRLFMRTAPLAACPASPYWHQEVKDDNDLTVRNMLRASLSEQFRESDYGAFGGRPFDMVPVYINAAQSFAVTVSELAPLPSGQDGTLWCRIRGKLIRDAS